MKPITVLFIFGIVFFSTELNAQCIAPKPGEAYIPCNDTVLLSDRTTAAPGNPEKDFIKEASASAMNMLATASEKYKAGLITKDQFLEIALQVGKMAEYAKKNSTDCLNTGLTGSGCSKEAMASLTPKK